MFLLLLSTDSPYCRCMCVFPLSSGLRLSAGLTTALSSGRLNSLTPSELSSLVRALYYDGEPRTRFLQLLASVTGGDMESASAHTVSVLSPLGPTRVGSSLLRATRVGSERAAQVGSNALSLASSFGSKTFSKIRNSSATQRIKDAIRETKSRIQEQARAYEREQEEEDEEEYD